LPRHLYMAASPSSSKARRELLSTSEAAARMGVCERTVRRYIATGRLASCRLPGGHSRIAPEAIAEFWRSHERRLPARQRVPTGGLEPPAARAARGTSGRRAPRLSTTTSREFDLSDEHLVRLRDRHASKSR
jgi:excisionase family DNA binding protein